MNCCVVHFVVDGPLRVLPSHTLMLEHRRARYARRGTKGDGLSLKGNRLIVKT